MAHLGRYELKKLSILLVPIESRWVICVEMNIEILQQDIFITCRIDVFCECRHGSVHVIFTSYYIFTGDVFMFVLLI